MVNEEVENNNVKINKKFIFYFLFLLMALVCFKDLIKIFSFYTQMKLNYFFAPIVLVGFLYFSFNYYLSSRYRKLNLLLLLSTLFFYWSGLYFTLYFYLSNDYGYSYIDLALILFFHCLLPLTFLFASAVNAYRYVFLIKRLIFIICPVVILSSYYILVMLLTERTATFDLFKKLSDAGVIVNPIQTSKTSIELRFSSIFSSAFTLVVFCNALLAFTLFYLKSLFKRTIIICLTLPILFLTLNRNGFLMAILLIAFYLTYNRSNKAFIFLSFSVFISIIFLALSIPIFVNMVDDLSFFNHSENVLTKLTTLLSRAEAWKDFFDYSNFENILFGTGFVQGLSKTSFYIDNNFYYLLAQGGFISFILFIVMMFYLFFALIQNFTKMKNNSSALALTLFLTGFSSLLLNNTFFDIIYIIFYFTFPIAVVSQYKYLMATFKD